MWTQRAVTITAIGVCVAALAPGAMAQLARGVVGVSVAQTQEYTRLAFDFSTRRGSLSATVQGDRLDVVFSAGADVDIAELRSTPPRFVRSIVRQTRPDGRPALTMQLEPGVRFRQFTDGQAQVIDLMAAPTGPPPPATLAGPVQINEGRDATEIKVTWSRPIRAAIVQRGETAWMVFEQAAQPDLRAARRAGRRHGAISSTPTTDATAIRIALAAEMRVSARAEGGAWILRIAPDASERPSVPVRRELGSDGRGRLAVAFGRDGVVRTVRDAALQDSFMVGLLDGAEIGVDTQRSAPEAIVLPSAHGALISPRAPDVVARFEGGELLITGAQRVSTPIAAEYTPKEPSLGAKSRMDFAEHQGVPKDLVFDRRAELERRAALEGSNRGASVLSRMELAQFLVTHELAAEALGALKVATINQPQLSFDPSFRLLRGIANAMMGRTKEAEDDLAVSGLVNDPVAALWRGYVAAQSGAWEAAQRNLERGRDALSQLSRPMRARFLATLAEAGVNNRDLAAGMAAAKAAEEEATSVIESDRARLLQGRVIRESGDARAALDVFSTLFASSDDRIAALANLEAVRARRALAEITPEDAATALDTLRFRWRGDDVELQVNQMLGALYVQMGRWRDGLDVMRAAATRYPDHPIGRQMRIDMGSIFESLFIDGEADTLDSVQALGLFYDFKELTPIGANGDRMVRALAGRLVRMDLLEQAAELLKYQVEQRLDGMAKAQIAADLAMVYLQDRKPEQALNAISSTRQPRMPPAMLSERRILEAKANLDLGRADIARELIERDRSPEAMRLRADIAWRERDWAVATTELRALASQIAGEGALADADRAVVLRAAIAAAMSDDSSARSALRTTFGARMAGTPDADAFELVAGDLVMDGVALRDLAQRIAQTDLLDRFMQGLRNRLAGGGAPVATPPASPPA